MPTFMRTKLLLGSVAQVAQVRMERLTIDMHRLTAVPAEMAETEAAAGTAETVVTVVTR